MAEKTVRLNLDWTYTPGPGNTSYGPGWVEVPASVAPALQRFHRPEPEVTAQATTTPETQPDPWAEFPGAAAFQAAGFDSPDAVLAHEGDLTEIENVGEKTAEKVNALRGSR